LIYGFSLYPLLIWLGIIYLGEHYVIDAVLGIIYAIIAFWVTLKFFKYLKINNLTISSWAQKPFRTIGKKHMLR